MSTPQEEITAIRDALQPRGRTPEENKALCEKYPFLAWYGDPLYMGYSENHVLDYEFTWEDELPEGWRKAFCPQMWDELKKILEKHNYLDKFRFVQIKEKYGTLRLYHGGVPEEIFEEICAWEMKYEALSETVCINCGKPSTKMTLGWISYVCDSCAKDHRFISIPLEDVDEFYEDPDAYREKHKEQFGE